MDTCGKLSLNYHQIPVLSVSPDKFKLWVSVLVQINIDITITGSCVVSVTVCVTKQVCFVLTVVPDIRVSHRSPGSIKHSLCNTLRLYQPCNTNILRFWKEDANFKYCIQPIVFNLFSVNALTARYIVQFLVLWPFKIISLILSQVNKAGGANS